MLIKTTSSNNLDVNVSRITNKYWRCHVELLLTNALS